MKLFTLLTRKHRATRAVSPLAYGPMASADQVTRYRKLEAHRASMQQGSALLRGLAQEAARNDALWAGRR